MNEREQCTVEPAPPDRTIEPDGWTLSDCGDDGWQCHRDQKVWVSGATREAAIAEAWRELDRVDLHALGARLCVEDLRELRDHGLGYLLLLGNRARPPDENPTWQMDINVAFGVHQCAMAGLHKDYGATSDFDIGDHLPGPDQVGEMCEVLVRVLYDSGDTDEYGRTTCPASFGVEVVKIGDKLAVEVW